MSSEKARYPTLRVVWSPELDFINDHVGSLATEMTIVHNAFIRALNSMYYNAPRVKPGDELSFAGYGLILLEILHEHHDIEETLIFPCIQSKFDMKCNVDQHHAFHKGLADLEAYLKGVEGGTKVFEGEMVIRLLDAFGDDLVQHLNDEIPTLAPERLAQIDEARFHAVSQELQNRIKSASLTKLHSFVLTHHDKSTAPTFPPAPWIMTWILSNVAYWRHSNYWKFAPFDRYGQPLEYR